MEKEERKRRLTNMISEGLRTIIFIIVIVFGSQFITNGYTPSFILSELSINVRVFLMIVVLIFGALGGVAAWYENEKRYQKIYLDLED
jgi:TRAP-type C4-dicarboxylate transport system permease small subunit